jgi:phosphatidylglycerol:prolipoprotein diacylglycerol transferase
VIALFPSRTVFLEIFDLSIHWYGVLYVVAFWIAYGLVPYLAVFRSLKATRDQWTAIIAYSALGVLVGGRLGYALLYEPAYYFLHPLEIFQIWNGGMSSHGGFVGVGAVLWMATRRYAISFLSLLDIATVPIAIGLALGRTGNFINEELGGVSYPVQLIDATIMVGIAILCYVVLRRSPKSLLNRNGSVIALFLISYSITRFFLEYVRIQEWSYIAGLSRGQFFTVPLFAIGVLLFAYANKRRI